MNFFDELKARGIINDYSHAEIIDLLNNDQISFYCGFDPTSKSLQLGNLFIIITMMRFQHQGHKPYALVGGATGMIGDPSGKSDERNLLSQETLEENVNGQKEQIQKLLNFDCPNNAVMLNNIDWISNFSLIDFLRDVGKRFRVGEMLAKDSVKSRVGTEAGLSFTEFSYQTIQGYDFAHLNKNYDVILQIGGSDQWGNMTAGMDLIRKTHKKTAFCLTIPLLTDSNGNKFGKSEGGAIYLDPNITSPYQMYQFLLNTDDASVIKHLKSLTFLSLEEIDSIEEKFKLEPHMRLAQKTLAAELVKLVHGEKGLNDSLRATEFFFGKKIDNVSDDDVSMIFKDIPSISIGDKKLGNISLIELLAQTPLFKSKSEAKKMIEQNGVAINNEKVSDLDKVIASDDLASETCLIIRKGKKNYCLIKFESSLN